MSKILILFVTLSTLAYVSAEFSTTLNINTTTPDGTEPHIANTLSQWLVDTVSRKIVTLARFFNLKLRIVRFLVSLWTPDNLVLLRNLLEVALKFGNFILGFLPQSVDDPSYWWVPAVSEFINAGAAGDSGFFGLFLGPVTPEHIEEGGSEISEIVTNPPVFFNAKLNTTEAPTTESNEIDRTKRLVTPKHEHDLDEFDADIDDDEDMEEKQYTREEILKKYEDNILTLDKLVNAGREY